MSTNRTKRRRISVRSIEEKMSDKIMAIHECSPKEAWQMIKFKAMQRELKAIG